MCHIYLRDFLRLTSVIYEFAVDFAQTDDDAV